ncbi:MAG: hypothetical protein C4B58_07195 [Deltaproteobacteria bacterium]|nr:MAG: hypothetical protein C4B58_07195 [Deltaproteobacteria bacterium]
MGKNPGMNKKLAHAVVYAYYICKINIPEKTTMQTAQTNLIRKQFLISESQIKKLDRLVKSTTAQGKKTSAAEMVRNAIDAYNPDGATNDLEASELIGLVHTRLQEAIKATKKANRVVAAGLKELS